MEQDPQVCESQAVVDPLTVSPQSLKFVFFFKTWHESRKSFYIREGVAFAQRQLGRPGLTESERATAFEFLALFLKIDFRETKRWQSLEDAIKSARRALKETPANDVYQWQRVSNVGALYQMKYIHKKDVQDMRLAICFVKRALSSPALDDNFRHYLVRDMVNLLSQKCMLTRDVKDIDSSIRYTKSVISAKTIEEVDGSAFLKWAIVPNGCVSDYYRGMCYYLPLELSADSDPRRPRPSDIGGTMMAKTTAHDTVSHLQRREVTPNNALVSEDYQRSNLENLSAVYTVRHEQTGEHSDLQEAIGYQQSAVKLYRFNGIPKASAVDSLSELLNTRYTETGNPDDLEEAITLCEEILSSPYDGQSRQLYGLVSLSKLLLARFDAKRNFEDLENAVKNGEEAFLRASKYGDSPNAPAAALSNALALRYDELGNLEDLQRAIELLETELSAGRVDGIVRTKFLYNLAILKGKIYRSQASGVDLDKAISLVHQASSGIIGQECILQADMIDLWSGLLFSKYESTGNIAHLEDAIAKAEKALLCRKTDSYMEKANRLNSLSMYLTRRFFRTHLLEDVNAAVRIAKEAVLAAPLGHPSRASVAHNLSVALSSRFTRNRSLQDLNEAIDWNEEALSATSNRAVSRIILLNSLANRLCTRFKATNSYSDLEQGILRSQEAVSASPPDHPYFGLNLQNLGYHLGLKYEVTDDKEFLFEAIKVSTQAVSVTSHDDPHRAVRLTCLGKLVALEEVFHEAGEDTQHPLEYYLEAWKCSSAPSLDRVRAGQLAIEVLAAKSQFAEASRLAESTLELILRVNLRSISWEDQENVIAALRGHASCACSFALQSGRTALYALQQLELARGIIIGLNIDFRSDLSTLRILQPSLCIELENILMILDPRQHERSEDDTKHNAAHQTRVKAAHALNEVLNRIRKIPCLQSFQLPPSEADLVSLAQRGPIVVLSSTKLRSDAIIVTSSGIEALNLPKLHLPDILEWTAFIHKQIPKTKLPTLHKNNMKLTKLLHWLWHTTVYPILQHLRLEASDSVQNLPHMWWVGVGPMGILPFHAAGDENCSSGEYALRYYISSYTPTIKALSFSREKQLTLFDGTHHRLLVAAMPKTPGQNKLEAAEEEVEAIQASCKPQFSVTTSIQPSAQEILETLVSHDVVHFACHGITNSQNPSHSHLLLGSAQHPSNLATGEEPTAEKLTVRDITALKDNQVQLMYISACHSASSASKILSDEVIHIASAFQLAGCSHAIGTLWTAIDQTCALITKEFYSHLMTNVNMGNDHKRIPAALHEAVKNARKLGPEQPLGWASFIHLGA